MFSIALCFSYQPNKELAIVLVIQDWQWFSSNFSWFFFLHGLCKLLTIRMLCCSGICHSIYWHAHPTFQSFHRWSICESLQLRVFSPGMNRWPCVTGLTLVFTPCKWFCLSLSGFEVYSRFLLPFFFFFFFWICSIFFFWFHQNYQLFLSDEFLIW